VSKEKPANPKPPVQGPLDRIQVLEDEVRALQLALSVVLAERRLKKKNGKEWLSELKEVALSGLAKQKAAQARRVEVLLTSFFDNIEKGISTLIRRKTTN